MKGVSNGRSRQIDIGVAYISGRIEHEIESFAPALGSTAEELTARVAAFLLSQGTGTEHHLSDVPDASTGSRHAVAKVEVAGKSRKRKARKGASNGSVVSSKKTKTTKSSKQLYWERMTPEERRAEAARRAKVALRNRRKRLAEASTVVAA